MTRLLERALAVVSALPDEQQDALARALLQMTNPDDPEACDDLAWAKPYVDEALAEVERGETFTLEQVEAHLTARFGPLEE